MINGVRSDIQDGHSEAEPEVLLPQYPDTIGVPLVLIDVVAVPQYNEYPSWKAAGSDTPDHSACKHNVLKARPILIQIKSKSLANVPT